MSTRQHIRWASPLSDHSHLLPGSSGKRLISCPGLREKVVLPGTAGVSEVNPPTRGRFTAMEKGLSISPLVACQCEGQTHPPWAKQDEKTG
ncbi:unnamed protein product [Lota lota]